MSKFQQANKKIESAVVDSYKKMEEGVVLGYQKIEDHFVDAFLAEEGEITAEAKARLTKKKQETQKENYNHNRRNSS